MTAIGNDVRPIERSGPTGHYVLIGQILRDTVELGLMVEGWKAPVSGSLESY
jgi:hypothetical protein